MPPSGVIYQSPSRLKIAIYDLIRGISAGFVAFAIVGIVFIFYPIIREETSFVFRQKEIRSGFGDILSRIAAQDADSVRNEALGIGLDSHFAIYIPVIDAKANIVANINPGNKDEYLEALSRGVAHAKGTNFPGGGGDIYLFSHSTDSPLNFARYNAVFYLLGKLEPENTVTIYFLDKKYQYRVTDKLITSANDTSWLESGSGAGERLILQTCYPPGTTLKRLIIVAVPK